ncbi:MAG: peptidoglycan DD-metalloendopeptidase family protein [Candidatus Sungiibacteriota bacterium]
MSVLTLFFVGFLVFFGIAPRRAEAGFFDNIFKFFGGEGQAAIIDAPSSDGLSIPLLGSDRTIMTAVGGPIQDDIVLVATQDNALVSTRNPLGILPSAGGSDQIVAYTVQAGDTPSAIAARFGISLNTLLWANNLRSASAIHAGDNLVILPVTGVQYAVKKGDTIDGIAKKFDADAMDIMSFNGLAIGEPLQAGMDIIIPDGELASPAPAPLRSLPPSRFAGLPELKGFLMRPITSGRNVRATKANPHGLHGFNGVDLASTCGLPVYASAAGSVIIARASGWNGGYGKYIVISHSNGVQTLYAHLSVIQSNVGNAVAQGTQIALIGSTGNSTGCHVHFEVRGAKNPF